MNTLKHEQWGLGDNFIVYITVFFLAVALFISSCGGGSGDGSTLKNLAPSADAGPDQTVDENTEVLLSGSGTDSDGMIVSYSWVQTSGKAVTLSGAETQNANFTAPYVESTEKLILAFQLTVTDDEGTTATDTVNITVSNISDNGVENPEPDLN